jgi:hypothetical protein
MYVNQDRVARMATLTSGESLVYFAVAEESSSERGAFSRKVILVFVYYCSTNGIFIVASRPVRPNLLAREGRFADGAPEMSYKATVAPSHASGWPCYESISM